MAEVSDLTFDTFPILDTRLQMILLSNGTLAIKPQPHFTPLADYMDGGVEGIFFSDYFKLKGKDEKEFQDYQYGVTYPYKNMPVLKAWLVQQQLEYN